MNPTHSPVARPWPPAAALAASFALALAGAAAPIAGATSLPQGFADSLYAGPLDRPVSMAFLPDGRLLVVEQKSARVRLVVNGGVVATPVLQVANVAVAGAEEGLLGIAVDPGWPSRPYLYIHCDDSALNKIRISRYTVAGDLDFTGTGGLVADPASRYDLINDILDNNNNHNGGTLRFGPDSMLYASIGEDDYACNATDLTLLMGVILRLDVTRLPAGAGGPPARSLITPPGNPYGGDPNENKRLVWTHGLRNPFRFHIDPADGALYIGDVGENAWEEVNRAAGGGYNFGWPAREGPDPGPFAADCGNPPAGEGPIHAYDRRGFTAAVITGGPYRKPAASPRGFPSEYEGDVFFSDYYEGFLRRLKGSGSSWSIAAAVPGQPSATDWGQGFSQVSDYLVGPDGALWYCRQSNFAYQANTGEIRRVVVTGSDAGAPPPPRPGVMFGQPRPTPARGEVSLPFSLEVATHVELAIFDLFGRRVRTLLHAQVVPAGAANPAPHWDGLDDDGRRVPSGVYVARLRAGGRTFERRVPMLQ